LTDDPVEWFFSPLKEAAMVRIPVTWIPGLIAGFIITLWLTMRGTLGRDLPGTLMSMAIILGGALAGKLLIEFIGRRRNGGHSAEYVRSMKSIDEFNRLREELNRDAGPDKRKPGKTN
jgi:hypothetical protein